MPKSRTLIKNEVSTYAQFLLDNAKDSDNKFELAGQIKQANAIIFGHPKLRHSLGDTAVDLELRLNAIKDIFKDFDPNLISLYCVIVERDELDILHRIANAYNELVEKDLNIVILDVITAVELDDNLRKMIIDKYSAYFGKDVRLRESIDPKILGGIILGAHGKRIDLSISSKLEQTRTCLSTVTGGGEN
ncbi:MAG: ATP synthase F1 subunit delta [Coriobacteriales bacterium]|nr:ATP synthase F1 subunit delta [Coriobacteriales bacterium]